MDYRIVSAVSGAMGGSASEEFLAPAPTGEDTFVHCTSCDYAANTEAVQLQAPAAHDPASQPALQVLDTPDTPTIDTLVEHLRARGHEVEASGTLKNVVVLLRSPDGTTEPLVVGVPGDRDVDLKRLEANVSPAEVLPFDGLRPVPAAGQGLHRAAGAGGAALRRRPPGRAGERLGHRGELRRPPRRGRRHGSRLPARRRPAGGRGACG
jgi:prolyl-tRNA synthetase